MLNKYITLFEDTCCIVEFNPSTIKYRVSFFENNHYNDHIEYQIYDEDFAKELRDKYA